MQKYREKLLLDFESSVIPHSLFVDCFQELSVSVWPGPIRTQPCDLAAVPHFQMHSHTPTLKSFFITSLFPNFHHFFTVHFSSLSLPSHFFQMSFHFVCFFVDYMQCEWFCQRSILLSTYFILPCREDQELLQLLCSDQSSLAVEVISCPC